MPLILLPISHIQQQKPSDCLVACAQMALNYFGKRIDYNRIAKKLDTKWFGTAMPNLIRLSDFGVNAEVVDLSIDAIRVCLEQNQVVIASVDTTDLPYWGDATFHAIVVVGMDDSVVYINDPALKEAPKVVSSADFELSLLTYNYLCAVISLREN